MIKKIVIISFLFFINKTFCAQISNVHSKPKKKENSLYIVNYSKETIELKTEFRNIFLLNCENFIPYTVIFKNTPKLLKIKLFELQYEDLKQVKTVKVFSLIQMISETTNISNQSLLDIIFSYYGTSKEIFNNLIVLQFYNKNNEYLEELTNKINLNMWQKLHGI